MSSIPPQRVQGLGERYIWLEITDGTRSLQVPCKKLSIPNQSQPEEVEEFIDGRLQSVFCGNDTVPAFAFDVPMFAFSDATETLLDDVLFAKAGTPGASWVPMNSSVSISVDRRFPIFRFRFHADGTPLGTGSRSTIRSVYASIKTATQIERANGMVIAYTGKVYGSVDPTTGLNDSITDSTG